MVEKYIYFFFPEILRYPQSRDSKYNYYLMCSNFQKLNPVIEA